MSSVGLVRPILVFYGGLAAFGLVLVGLRQAGLAHAGTCLASALASVVTFCVLWSQIHTRAALVERCLGISKRHMQVQLALATVLLPLYPFLALPFIVLSSLMATMGYCSL